MSLLNFIKKNSEKFQLGLSTAVKIFLIISIVYAIYSHLWHIVFANTMLLFLLLLPSIIRRKYEIHIPTEFEFILLIFIIISFFLGSMRGFVIQLFFGAAIGFIGFTIMLILFSNSKIKTNYFLIFLFSLCFSVALGLCIELAKFYLKTILDYEFIASDYIYTMRSLTLVFLGAFFAAALGYGYMKGPRATIMKKIVTKFKTKNPNFFTERIDSPEEVIEMIKKGETDKIEFKSTLRINLHTGDTDKKVENSALKTITGFLNSGGGTLLIGVNDSGEILGIEKDKFLNNDRFNLHFTNLFKERIGNLFLNHIDFEIISITDKQVLKVECIKSNKPVFLKTERGEEFYIRVGPASVLLTGSKLIQYIDENFRK